MKTKLHYVLTIAMLLFVFSSFAQNLTWKEVKTVKYSQKLSDLNLNKNEISLFKLDIVSFKKQIASSPLKGLVKTTQTKAINVPVLKGKSESFMLYEASVLSPKLAAKYPNIKSYVGVSIQNPNTRLRMSVSPKGVQTMISYVGRPTVFMQPIAKGSDTYVVYEKKSKNKLKNRFQCKTIDAIEKKFSKSSTSSKINEGGANNKTLQKFRIAISTTGEYTAYHDDGNEANGDAVADALAAINATLSRVNQVFEADMAIRFELVDATQLIYTDASTDPYSIASVGVDSDNSNNINGWGLQVQNTLTTEIGNAAYDIGHLFGASGAGGSAGCIGCICEDDSASTNDKNKGSAFSSPLDGIPEGDTFDIDLVIHELGHQMGANHTWSFDTEGSGVNSEPGSGTTIMAYAGLEGQNNVELNSDDYFHYYSIKQILDNVNTKSCQTTEPINNNPPIANAGSDYNIPKGTAYILKGAATDVDSGDNLSYCWEQIDSGLTSYLNFGPDLTFSSMNRSLPPSSNPDRYIPKFSSVLNGDITQSNPVLGSDWETVSNVARTLNWALTVRDRAPIAPAGGQTSYDRMQITVEDVTPFSLKNPVFWAQGSTQIIEWVVGQTNNATINCQNVNIKLSIDGGLTFPTTIAFNTPNVGSFSYTVPAISNTSNARLLIEAADNIFYDVSDYNFSISNEPDFFIVEEVFNPIDCGDTTVVYNFDYEVANGFSDNTVFSASGMPGNGTVSFSPESRSNSGNVTMTINNLDGVIPNNYNIIVTGTVASSPSKTKSTTFDLPFFNSTCTSEGNVEYNTGTTLVQFNTINNQSSEVKQSGYTFYNSSNTDLNRGSAYNLNINVNTDGNFTTNTIAWIDWNQNCEFEAGETYNMGDATNITNSATAESPRSITIPNNAVLGNTLMRVSTKYTGDSGAEAPAPCENGFDGEVEDYIINVMPTLYIEEYGFENFSVYPNPSDGDFTIQLSTSLSNEINVGIFDLRGRAIFSKLYNEGGDFKKTIRLKNVQSGMYILNISNTLRQITKKIIIN